MYEDKTKDEIFAEALVLIIENQIEIKRHFGLAKGDEYYGDCYYDREMIRRLNTIT